MGSIPTTLIKLRGQGSMDWNLAKRILDKRYRNFINKNARYMVFRINILYERYEKGERTEYLYNDIMDLDYEDIDYQV